MSRVQINVKANLHANGKIKHNSISFLDSSYTYRVGHRLYTRTDCQFFEHVRKRNHN